jgi:hypothetical protein
LISLWNKGKSISSSASLTGLIGQSVGKHGWTKRAKGAAKQ